MHPYVKPIQLASVFFVTLIMLSSATSRNCNNSGVRRIQLYSKFTNEYVRIERRKVIANSCIEKCSSNHFLQTVTIDRHYFVIYDPQAKMFICWNKPYTNLVAKRNPQNLSYCKFEEQVSIKHPKVMTRYTTRTRKSNEVREVEMRFNKSGNFAHPKFIRKCLERRKRRKATHQYFPKVDVEFTMNLNPLNITKGTREFEAYGQLTEYCADPDFFVISDSSGDCGLASFCKDMKLIQERHKIAHELSNFCQKRMEQK